MRGGWDLGTPAPTNSTLESMMQVLLNKSFESENGVSLHGTAIKLCEVSTSEHFFGTAKCGAKQALI